MDLTSFSLRRPVTTVMIFLSIIIIGMISLKLLPLEFFPDMDYPFISIEIPYPNSTPVEVERELTRPAEEVLATISSIKNMYSYSAENSANITLEFEWGVDTDVKAIEAKEKLDGIRHLIPDDVEHYFVNKFNMTDQAILTLRLSSNRDLSNAYDLLDRNIKRKIERLEGVSRVNLYGVEKKEIQIQLNVNRLAAHHVNIGNLVQDLRRSNFSVTAGRITDNKQRLSVRPMGEFRSLDDYRNMIIGNNNLRLGDVAEVAYGHPRLDYGRHLDQKYAIGLDVFKEGGANTVEVNKLIMTELEEIKNNPEMEGINIYHMDNQSDGIMSSLEELFKSGMLGALMATLILFFFLRRWITTFIVTLAVPFSILVTLFGMYFLDISLNILSMMGLMLAVGMLVDNAVVATESIHRHQIMNGDPGEATITGVKEISLAITAGTLTTIIVFLPQIVSSNDEISIQMKHVSIALCISLVASLILAQTIVPLLASRFKVMDKVKKPTVIDRLLDSYTKVLGWTLNHRGWTSLIILAVLFSIAVPASLVKFDMFPDQQRDRRLRLFFHINDSYTVKEVEKSVYVIEDYLYSHKEEFEIESVYTYYTGNYAESTILLKKDDGAHKAQTDIREEIRKELPEIAIGNLSFERHRTTGGEGGIEIQLIGKSSEELTRISKDLSWTLEKIQGLEDVRSEAETGEKEVHVIVDRERGSKYGFSTSMVANVVSAAMRGVRLRKFKTKDGEVDVRLQFQEKDKQNLENLYNLPLFDQNNKMFRLGSIADFSIQHGPQGIRRTNRVTSLDVTANLVDMTVSEAREEIQKVMDNYKLPPGYSWNYGQRFTYEEEAAKTMLTNMLLALVLIYLVMAALFESLIYPAGIWSSILFAIIGVYWFFLFTGTTMSVMAMIGILILIGVVVNNGIVLVDHILHLRSKGLSRNDAILQAGKDRMRPILMTAATTIFSLLPLTMVTTQIGGGGPPYFPMARAIVGGLTFSTVVTLLILPTIYILLDNMRNWARRVISSAKS